MPTPVCIARILEGLSVLIPCSTKMELLGQDLGSAMFTGAWQGALTGFVFGGIYGGAKANANGLKYWSGKSKLLQYQLTLRQTLRQRR